MNKTCQMTMSDGGRGPTGVEKFWACGKPAKAWIPDVYNRSGWNGRQYLCGVHARAHDRIAERLGRPKATPI